ncbi:hypothetical protein GOODEAATRI_002960 [Goodea atripinnis]|uniref:Uncharacterized protein n=1 Tax=Goodea atripinnis TaxID=208336 RepID=A0ABV0NRF7_9TELE
MCSKRRWLRRGSDIVERMEVFSRRKMKKLCSTVMHFTWAMSCQCQIQPEKPVKLMEERLNALSLGCQHVCNCGHHATSPSLYMFTTFWGMLMLPKALFIAVRST